jgi:ribosomal protein S18 acetylase RimI-like enzyme
MVRVLPVRETSGRWKESGRSAAWLAHQTGGLGVVGSNPAAPIFGEAESCPASGSADLWWGAGGRPRGPTMSVPVRFRRAVPADVPAIVALVESCYRGEPSRAGWTTEADLLGGRRTSDAEVAAIVGGERTRMVLGEDDGELVAAMRLEDEDAHLYVGMLSVRPTLQASGLGKALLVEAERIARELGRPKLRMTVIEQRPELLAFYARRGYAATGETEPFPYGDDNFGEPKRRDLRFVVLEKAIG